MNAHLSENSEYVMNESYKKGITTKLKAEKFLPIMTDFKPKL